MTTAIFAAGCAAGSTGVGLTGEFGGDAAAGCTWLTDDLGQRVPIAWGAGYQAAFEPVRLLSPDGSVVAHEGDRVHLGGGEYSRSVSGLDPVCGEVGPFRSAGSVDVTPRSSSTSTAS